MSATYPLFVKRDLDGFFGLFIDNLVQEQSSFIQQPFFRFHAFYDNGIRVFIKFKFLFFRDVFSCVNDNRRDCYIIRFLQFFQNIKS